MDLIFFQRNDKLFPAGNANICARKSVGKKSSGIFDEFLLEIFSPNIRSI